MLLSRKNLYGNSIIVRACCFVFCFNCVIGLKTFRYICRNKIHWEGSKSSHYSQEKLGWQPGYLKRGIPKRDSRQNQNKENAMRPQTCEHSRRKCQHGGFCSRHIGEKQARARRLSTRHRVAWARSPLSFPPPAAKSPGPSAYCIDFIIRFLKTLNVCRQICPS